MPWCGHAPPIEGCHRCKLVMTDDRYRRLWGIDDETLRPCKHLGERTGENLPCSACKEGKGMIPVHVCQVFGACTTAKQMPQLACCFDCARREI